ncbi:MAG: uracil-DNA glycosylase [Gammaproteobacteria bacterium]|jgi:uracil-DNA glycosylase|nr:uracil-DNA glycosylase [Gammaproteobacteria bacterium]
MTSTPSRAEIFKAIGIRQWHLRDRASFAPTEEHSAVVTDSAAIEDPAVLPVSVPEPVAPTSRLPPVPATAEMWEKLRERVSACTQCDLHALRTQTVFGSGNSNSDWMIVGEAPSGPDDVSGQPFSDQPGRLLDEMLVAAGLSRSAVYLTHVVKCHAGEERPPQAVEVSSCGNHLATQIDMQQPKLIFALGLTAARELLGITDDVSLGSLRGQVHVHSASSVPVIVSYHPRYLLRKPTDKRKAWEDLQLARQLVFDYQS